jgi:hypothetical protein
MRALVVGFLLAGGLAGAEPDAIEIERTLVERHLPFGIVVDPIFVAADSAEIANYTRCGDSAIWTGHYLAAASYRFAVTRSDHALEAVSRALTGIELLVDVTGTDVLARCAVPADSPWVAGIAQEEQHHGVRSGVAADRQYVWIGNTSRDQYIGAFFGLTTANDLVDAGDIRNRVRTVVTRLLERLIADAWIVRMPDGEISTTFLGRADQQLSLLKIGQRVDSGLFGGRYQSLAWTAGGAVVAPIAVEVLDPHGAYFKFNLDTATLSALVRYEGNWWLNRPYRKAYDILRRTTDDHGNAHFNMIDRAVNGPNSRRDGETRRLLDEWLARPKRDFYVDNTAQSRVCDENRACEPIAVVNRTPTDFLWQRSPFQLYGGGDGFIEGPGIDYLLPYWMARYYGVVKD